MSKLKQLSEDYKKIGLLTRDSFKAVNYNYDKLDDEAKITADKYCEKILEKSIQQTATNNANFKSIKNNVGFLSLITLFNFLMLIGALISVF